MSTLNIDPKKSENPQNPQNSLRPGSLRPPITNLKDLETTLLNFTQENPKKNVIEYMPFLHDYCGSDWQTYIKFDDKNYVRNNVFSNEFFDLHVITWDVGQGSQIHDHPENGCVFKILQGRLQETKYNRETVEIAKITKLEENKIGYINNEIGIHQIRNDCEGVTVSLHVYSPPRQQCNYFN